MQLLGMPNREISRGLPPRLGHKPMVLLARLLLEPRPMAREALMTFLWPEANEDRARGSLRQALHMIREAVGFDCFLTDRRSVALRVAPASDLHTFLHATRACDWFTAALAYGGPLLDGVTLVDASDAELWLDFERRRIGKLFETASITALEDASAAPSDERRLEVARRLRDHNPRLSRSWQFLFEELAARHDHAGLRLEQAALSVRLETGQIDHALAAHELLQGAG
jgi:DNA-binding SARP family transcriptional activator